MLIRNATAYVDGKFQKKDILIENQMITKVADHIETLNPEQETIDASGLFAFPGLIEMHAHLREPGQTQKEDFLSGSRAALAGGYTLVYDMPNNMPKPTITKEALEEKKKLAQKAECEIRFHFGTTKDNFSEVRKANPESLKLYLGKTTGNLLIDKEVARQHMQLFPKNRQIIVHAQMGETREGAITGAQAAVSMAKELKRKVHITHVSTCEEIEAVHGNAETGNWKRETGRCSVDTAPHYLFLDADDAKKMKERGLVMPPLRAKKDVSEMWKRLEKIDAIATDHAPHLLEDKLKGAHGFPGMETALALFLDAYSKKMVSLEWMAQRFSENPAKIMGLKKYGKIKNGFVGNITLVDLKKEWAVKGSELYTKCKWSPFEGRKLRGKVVKTICKGKIAFEL